MKKMKLSERIKRSNVIYIFIFVGVFAFTWLYTEIMTDILVGAMFGGLVVLGFILVFWFILKPMIMKG